MTRVAPSDPVFLAGHSPPRANRFIVTLYGDVVEPRGGALWMGSLIESCAQQGISESLVRTAVSRLVASGHLEGERIGRKSFYRLSASARTEFAQAARLFYDPLPAPQRWALVLGHDEPPGRRWARLGPRSYIGADIPDDGPADGVLLSAEALSGAQCLASLAAELWPLADLAEQYAAFAAAFAELQRHLWAGGAILPAEALRLRLQLVHRFRLIVLQDPRLPEEALCADWPGRTARRLFVDLYLLLTELADKHIAQTMCDAKGALPRRTDATDRRKAALRDCQRDLTV